MSIENEAELKAKELLDKFISVLPNLDYEDRTHNKWDYANQCVIIAVDEILSIKMIYAMSRNDKYSEGEFYELVKEKIKTL